MKIIQTEIESLTKEEIKTLIFFLMRNKHFLKQMFPYLNWQSLILFLIIGSLIGGSIYLINKKFDWLLVVEKKDDSKNNQNKKGEKFYYGKKKY
jgi:hypothetical protein